MPQAASLCLALTCATATGCGASIATCIPGAQASCACVGTSSPGAQTCGATGTFAECECAATASVAGVQREPQVPLEVRDRSSTVISGGSLDGCIPDPVADAARRAFADEPATPAWVVLQDLDYVDDHRHGPEICVTFEGFGGSESVTYWTYGPVGGACLHFLGEVQDERGDRDVPE